MPVKYEREEKTLRDMKEHYLKEDGFAFVMSQVLLGWETEELRRLLDQSFKTANAIQAEIDTVLATIARRRAK